MLGINKSCRKLPFDMDAGFNRKLSQLKRADVIALHTNFTCEEAWEARRRM